MKRRWIDATAILVTAGVVALTGCTTNSATNENAVAVATSPHGEVYGGQQPVSGMSLQLYAAGSSGYGSAATPLFMTPPTTSASGGFTFPAYSCPMPTVQVPNPQVYLVGTSGDPIAGNTGGADNPNLALMVALGSCSSLNSGTHIHMNELTTVAAAWALAPFMAGSTTSYLNVGTSSTNATGLQLAFEASSEVVNTSTGTFPGTLPSGATLPTATLNTLADVLEACINSKGGTANDGTTTCGTLFGLTEHGRHVPHRHDYRGDEHRAESGAKRDPAQHRGWKHACIFAGSWHRAARLDGGDPIYRRRPESSDDDCGRSIRQHLGGQQRQRRSFLLRQSGKFEAGDCGDDTRGNTGRSCD